MKVKNLETTLILIKPDGVQRGLMGQIISRIEQKGLQIRGMKLMNVTEEIAGRHYGEHVGKPFFNDNEDEPLDDIKKIIEQGITNIFQNILEKND